MLRTSLVLAAILVACCALLLLRTRSGGPALTTHDSIPFDEDTAESTPSRVERPAEERVSTTEVGVGVDSRGLTPLHRRSWFRVHRASDGVSVQGARLFLCAPEYSHLSWTSDDEGFAPIDVERLIATLSSVDAREFGEPWGLSFEAECSGFGPRILRLETGHDERESAHTIYLEAEAVIRCTVKTWQAEPIAGATVRASVSGAELGPARALGTSMQLERVLSFRTDPLLNRLRHVGGMGARDWSTATDENGIAEIRGLPAGVAVNLLVVAEGFAHEVPLNPPTLGVGEVRNMEWLRPRTGQVQGVLMETEGQPPTRFTACLVRRARADAESTFLLDEDAILAESAVGADGTFRFPVVPLGSYHCGLLPSRHPPGLTPAVRTVVSAGTLEPQVQLGLSTRGFLDVAIAGVTNQNEAFAIEARRDGIDGFAAARCDAAHGYSLRIQPLPIGEYVVSGRGNMGSTLQAVSCSTGSQAVLSVTSTR